MMVDSLSNTLAKLLPTEAELDASFAEIPERRTHVPIVEGKLAAPYEFAWSNGVLSSATFEIYDLETPLGRTSEKIYRAFLAHPEAATTQCLILGNVACKEFHDSQLLGDGVRLLARVGLPPHLERLEFKRLGPVTNAGDLGYYAVKPLAPLLDELKKLREIHISGCESLGKFDLPKLQSLHLHSDVSGKNLKELARANMPALTHLELSCDLYAPVEQRFKAFRSLLRSSKLPRLESLVIAELDLDEDARMELDDEDAEGEPDSWVDMIADSPILKQLKSLDLWFREDERELPTLIERAEAFQHLESLEIWGKSGRTKLTHPSVETIRAALNS